MAIEMTQSLADLGIETGLTIEWRESTREVASKYKNPYTGFTRADYAMQLDVIPIGSLVEMVTRSYGHMENNETISAVGRAFKHLMKADKKAEKERTPTADEFKWVHDRRMEHRSRVLEGKLGVRQSTAAAPIDPITQEWDNQCLARVVSAFKASGVDLSNTVPNEYSVAVGKIVLNDKSLADWIAQVKAADVKGVLRAKAEKIVEELRLAREKAAAEDEDFDIFAEPDSEEEDETEAA